MKRRFAAIAMLMIWRVKRSAFLAVLAVAACGTTTSTTMVAPVLGPTSFRVVDDRPEAQRISSRTVLSEGVVMRLGDDAITPPPADLLKAWLAKDASAPALTGKTIRLTGFSLDVVDPSVELSASAESSYISAATSPRVPAASAAIGGLIGYALLSSRSGKTVRVQIAASVDGRPVSSESFRKYAGRVSETDINVVLREALGLLAADLTAVANGAQPRNQDWSSIGNRWPKRAGEPEQ